MLEIRRLSKGMEQALALFFSDVAEGNYAQYYYPYSLTSETAKKLCSLSGKDMHYVLTDNETILGHGMLRGWDEGYSVPSLGIVVHPGIANKGLGTMLVRFLHSAAWMRGCSKVRLSVHKENSVAINIYKKLGYIFEPKNSEELTGIICKESK